MAGIGSYLSSWLPSGLPLRSGVRFDASADRIPGVSLVTNLVNLAQKAIVIPLMSQETVEKSRYYTHLQQKSFSHCMLAVIPGVMSSINSAEKEQIYSDMTRAIEDLRDRTRFDRMFEGLSLVYKTDPDFVMEIIKLAQSKNGYSYRNVIKNLPEELRTEEFAVRILQEVIFTKNRKESTVEGEFEVVIDGNAIKADVLRVFQESIKKEESPIPTGNFIALIWKANEEFLRRTL